MHASTGSRARRRTRIGRVRALGHIPDTRNPTRNPGLPAHRSCRQQGSARGFSTKNRRSTLWPTHPGAPCPPASAARPAELTITGVVGGTARRHLRPVCGRSAHCTPLAGHTALNLRPLLFSPRPCRCAVRSRRSPGAARRPRNLLFFFVPDLMTHRHPFGLVLPKSKSSEVSS